MFVGRDSWDIVLDELALEHCDLFWGRNRSRISTFDKLALLSVTGGVPRYLEEIDPGISADENIRHLCFSAGGILFRGFDQIFGDVFGKRATNYRAIVETLVQGPRTISEISERLEVSLDQLPGWESVLSITSRVVDEVRTKLRRLPVGRELSVRTVLVYEGELDQKIEQEDFFDFVVPFGQLLCP